VPPSSRYALQSVKRAGKLSRDRRRGVRVASKIGGPQNRASDIGSAGHAATARRVRPPGDNAPPAVIIVVADQAPALMGLAAAAACDRLSFRNTHAAHRSRRPHAADCDHLSQTVHSSIGPARSWPVDPAEARSKKNVVVQKPADYGPRAIVCVYQKEVGAAEAAE
jgi:hypothetical protein